MKRGAVRPCIFANEKSEVLTKKRFPKEKKLQHISTHYTVFLSTLSWKKYHGMVNGYKSHLHQMIKSIVPTSFFLGFLGEELAALGPGMIFQKVQRGPRGLKPHHHGHGRNPEWSFKAGFQYEM